MLSRDQLETVSALFSPTTRPGHPAPEASLLLETKLHPPLLPASLIERTHLHAQLDTCLTHKLVLLQAPAGFGKTTLVNQWLATRPISRAWVSLDERDNDLLRFWRYIIAACQQLLSPEQQPIGQAVQAQLQRSPADLPTLDTVLTPLLNALAAPSSGGLLVLDDYHVINEPLVHETLAFFVDYLPESTHILLLSRTEPELPLLLWRARGELSELRGADLRFSQAEMSDFLRKILPFSLSDDLLKRLESTIEGWAAGLRLLSLTLARWRTAEAIEQAVYASSTRAPGMLAGEADTLHHSLLDYFASEILATQPEPIQLFLLQTSILDRLCAPLCNAVTESEQGADLLEAIDRAGLFLDELEGPGRWYRYHALFAEAMRREAARRLGETALQALLLRASEWYEREAYLTEAIDAAWLASDLERVATLIEQANRRNYNEPHTIQRWLHHFPENLLQAHPLLCLLLATELCFPIQLRLAQKAVSRDELLQATEQDRARSEALLQRAEKIWRDMGQFPWIGAIYAHRALHALTLNEPFSLVIQHAKQALHYFQGFETTDPRLLMYRASVQHFYSIEQIRLGAIDEAQRLLTLAQKDLVPPENRFLATDIQLMQGRCALLQGKLHEAHNLFHDLLSVSEDISDAEMHIDILLNLASIAFERNELDATERLASEALQMAQANPIQAFIDRAKLALALVQYARGEMQAALAHLEALQAVPQQDESPNHFQLPLLVHEWVQRLRLASGKLHALPEPDKASPSFALYLRDGILLGRLWLAQGRYQEAIRQFTTLLPEACKHLQLYRVAELRLLLALAYNACKQEQQALERLRQTLLQTAHEGCIRLYLNEGAPLLHLLRVILPSVQHDAILRPYIQRILEAAHSGEKRTDSQLLEPLSLQEERVLRLLAAGWNNQDIADEMIISVNTVKYHIKRLYQKLGVSNRTQAGEVAHRLGL